MEANMMVSGNITRHTDKVCFIIPMMTPIPETGLITRQMVGESTRMSMELDMKVTGRMTINTAMELKHGKKVPCLKGNT